MPKPIDTPGKGPLDKGPKSEVPDSLSRLESMFQSLLMESVKMAADIESLRARVSETVGLTQEAMTKIKELRAGGVKPADLEALEQQLAESNRQLALVLDDPEGSGPIAS